MKSGARGFRQAIRTAILLGTVSAAALANQMPTLRSEPVTPLCYCHCAYETGMKHCTKMCELPQYQDRWWAISCQKKNSTSSESSLPASNSGSKKTNRKEQASLWHFWNLRSQLILPFFSATSRRVFFHLDCSTKLDATHTNNCEWIPSESSMVRARSIFTPNVR